jgi:hypothetical protein
MKHYKTVMLVFITSLISLVILSFVIIDKPTPYQFPELKMFPQMPTSDNLPTVEGVEQATASFKEGLVTAWIHPHKVNRLKLEEALRKKGVKLLKPMKPAE